MAVRIDGGCFRRCLGIFWPGGGETAREVFGLPAGLASRPIA